MGEYGQKLSSYNLLRVLCKQGCVCKKAIAMPEPSYKVEIVSRNLLIVATLARLNLLEMRKNNHDAVIHAGRSRTLLRYHIAIWAPVKASALRCTSTFIGGVRFTSIRRSGESHSSNRHKVLRGTITIP